MLSLLAAAQFAFAPSAVALSAAAPHAVAPHARVVVGESGLDAVSAAALPVINQLLSGGITVPDMTLTVHVPVVGHVDLTLTNIQVRQTSPLRAAKFAIAPTPPPTPGSGKLLLDVDGLSLTVSLDFRWRKRSWPHVSDKGALTATVSDGHIALGVEMDPVAAAPAKAVGDCTATLGDFKVHFSKHWDSWVYNIFTDLFKGTLKDAVVKAIDNTVATTLVDQKLNALFASMPTTLSLGGGPSRIDLSLIITDFTTSAAPLALSIGDSLAVADNATAAACPLPMLPMPTLAPGGANSSMAQLLLSDNTLACVLWVDFSNGALDFDGVRAGTTKLPWGPILPKLAQKEGDKPVILHLVASSMPTLASRRATGLRATVDFSVNSSVLEADNVTRTYTHALAVSADAGIDLRVATAANGTNATLVGNVSSLTLDASVADCGALCPMPFTNSTLALFTKAFSATVRAALDGLLSKGIPITGGAGAVGLVNPSVFFEDGYIAISTDFRL